MLRTWCGPPVNRDVLSVGNGDETAGLVHSDAIRMATIPPHELIMSGLTDLHGTINSMRDVHVGANKKYYAHTIVAAGKTRIV